MERKNARCAVASCDKPVDRGEYCPMHRSRLKRHGDVNKTLRSVPGSGMALLRSLVGRDRHDDACIEWPFGYFTDGYPRIRVEGQSRHATRVMCLMANGIQPDGKSEAAHRCGNKRCVNPAHLEWKSATENAADKIVHGTNGAGESNPRAKLAAVDVAEIRELFAHGAQIPALAATYRITPQNVRHIVTGKTWKAA